VVRARSPGCAARLLTEHLLELGQQRIAFLGGPETWIADRARRLAWLKSLAKAGFEPGPMFFGDWTAAQAYGHAKVLLQNHRGEFTAVIAGGDLMVVGILRAFREHRIRVPQDISIGSFGDLPFASFLYPSVTTVRQDFAQVGSSGFACLMSLVENPCVPCPQLKLEPELKIRESTGPARNLVLDGRKTLARAILPKTIERASAVH
jgi:DNA-binding LacI/PurR family transcriptional regulator